jgi:hypothetical protein
MVAGGQDERGQRIRHAETHKGCTPANNVPDFAVHFRSRSAAVEIPRLNSFSPICDRKRKELKIGKSASL